MWPHHHHQDPHVKALPPKVVAFGDIKAVRLKEVIRMGLNLVILGFLKEEERDTGSTHRKRNRRTQQR